ncbi:hypothetical protein [Xylanibacter ruminicola]|uniref:Uncharacterized protein n=1 Tax=Xylanibacter ruminicola TaxID=839 RepID=A0A1M6V9Z3_XYLRU|nr:hypothetical protein [Xylanibacter ruminicola]SHK78126.1 hypothetical protein SAMN05216463_1121 [Xylanibacter ruminicola]
MTEDKIKKQKEDEQLKDEQLDEVNGGQVDAFKDAFNGKYNVLR